MVVRVGWYNAFTDLAYWKDYYWLSYRRGTGHYASNSVEMVLRSNDTRWWHEVIAFETPYGIAGGKKSGAGGGHFCTTPDRLYMFFNTRQPSHVFGSWTADGVTWSKPALVALDGEPVYTWRVRWHEGKFYSGVRWEDGLDLIVSEDGSKWTRHA